MSAREEFSARLRAGAVVTGAFLQLGSPLAAEAMALAGYDWLVIDLEHGHGDERDALTQLQAITGHGVAAFVRTETADRIRIGRALDAGADGVLVPRLLGAEDARAAAQACRYAGARGVARYTRSFSWGARATELADADAGVLCAVQIETPSALAEVDAIAAIEGIDVLFVGPSDLAHGLALTGGPTQPELLRHCEAVARAARAHGKAAGMLVGTAEQALAYRRLGFTFLGAGTDGGALMTGARQTAQALRAPDGNGS